MKRMNTDLQMVGFGAYPAKRGTRFACPFVRVYLCSSVFLLFAASCAVGPTYVEPKVETPQAFREGGAEWRIAQPKDDAPRGKWWVAFGDPVLSGLVEQVEVSNQSLAAAEARYRQARTSVQAARSQLFPTIGASGGASRSRRGDGQTNASYDLGLDARWEIDLWGRVRRIIEANQAGAAASQGDLEAARLSLQAELAANYFQLRVTDVQKKLLEDTIVAFERSLTVTQNRYKAGVAARVDVVQAEAQLLSTRAQAVDLGATRATLEHGIAVLIGKPPAVFSLPPVDSFTPRLPAIPPVLPSTLLERRPDIAAAERRVAAANARIGVAQAAYFPTLGLTGSGGFASSALSSLISAPSRVWSLGLGLAATLLDFGARGAEVERTRAAYDETVANYRQTVLEAFQEVEDGLSTARILGDAEKIQQDAARAARESVVLTQNQYKAGTVSYLNVVQVQATQLNEDRQTVQLLGRRLSANVALVRALGGSW